MRWYWDQYTIDPEQRAGITASPPRATPDQRLRQPPPRRWRPGHRGGHQGMIHDFVGINALRQTQAAQGAITRAISVLRAALGTG